MTLKGTLFCLLAAGVLIFVNCSNVVGNTKTTQNHSVSSPLFYIRSLSNEDSLNSTISRQYLGENSEEPLFSHLTIDNKMNQIISIMHSGPTQKVNAIIKQAICNLINSGKINRDDSNKITMGLNELIKNPEFLRIIIEKSQKNSQLIPENVWLPGKFLPFLLFIFYFAIIIVYAVFYQVYQCFNPNDPNLTFYQCTLVP